MLKQQPEKSIDQRIRDEFDAVGGGMTTSQFAAHCIDAGVWSDDEITSGTLRWAQSEVRSALKKPDAFGLPFAGKTATTDLETKAPVWRQRTYWEYQDYALNIGELVSERDVLHQNALMLQSECRSKFGKAPSVPGLDEGELDALA